MKRTNDVHKLMMVGGMLKATARRVSSGRAVRFYPSCWDFPSRSRSYPLITTGLMVALRCSDFSPSAVSSGTLRLTPECLERVCRSMDSPASTYPDSARYELGCHRSLPGTTRRAVYHRQYTNSHTTDISDLLTF
jgi:hypothetical protein